MVATGCQLLPRAGFDFENDKPDPNAWTHGGDAETWRPGIGSLAYSPDGKRLVTSLGGPTQGVFDESTVSGLFASEAVYELWNTPDWLIGAHQQCRVSIAGGKAARISVSSDSDVFAVRHLMGVDFCRMEDGALIKRIDPPTDEFSGYYSVVSPDCRFVAWPQSRQDESTTFGIEQSRIAVASIFIQDVASEKIIRTFPQTSTGVSVEKFSPDGRFLAIALFDGRFLESEPTNELTIQLIDLHTGKVSFEIPNLDKRHYAQELISFSRDGSTLAVLTMSENTPGEKQPVISTWDVKLGKQIAKWPIGTDRMVWDLTFSADGKQLIGGIEYEREELEASKPEVRVWETSSGRTVTSWIHQDASDDAFPSWGITAVAMSPDGKTLAAGTSNGSIRFYDVPQTAISRP